MADFKIWMNGKLVPQAEAVLPVNSAAVFYATNVFEGLRAYWNAADGELYAFRLAEHFARIRESMKMMRFTVPYSDPRPLRRRPRGAARQRGAGGRPHAPGGLRWRGRAGLDLAHRALHQPAAARADHRGRRAPVLRDLLAAHLGQRHPHPAQVRLQLPEWPARHAPGQGRRLRRAHLPQPARHGRRGVGRDVLHGPARPARHPAAHQRHPRVHHPRHPHRVRGPRAGDGGRGAAHRAHRALRRRRSVLLRQRLRDHADPVRRPLQSRRRRGGADHPAALHQPTWTWCAAWTSASRSGALRSTSRSRSSRPPSPPSPLPGRGPG